MSKFLVWVDDDLSVVKTYNEFSSASGERATGFVSGSYASASWVNTALRQANLVVASFMDSILPTDTTLDFRSNKQAVTNAIKSHLRIDLNLNNGAGTNSLIQGASNNTASGANSAAFGLGHNLSAQYSFAVGRYSDSRSSGNKDYLFAVGNGQDNATRLTAFGVDTSNNAYFKGQVNISKAPSTNNDATRKIDFTKHTFKFGVDPSFAYQEYFYITDYAINHISAYTKAQIVEKYLGKTLPAVGTWYRVNSTDQKIYRYIVHDVTFDTSSQITINMSATGVHTTDVYSSGEIYSVTESLDTMTYSDTVSYFLS